MRLARNSKLQPFFSMLVSLNSQHPTNQLLRNFFIVLSFAKVLLDRIYKQLVTVFSQSFMVVRSLSVPFSRVSTPSPPASCPFKKVWRWSNASLLHGSRPLYLIWQHRHFEHSEIGSLHKNKLNKTWPFVNILRGHSHDFVVVNLSLLIW